MDSPKFVSALVLLVVAAIAYFISDNFLTLAPSVAIAVGTLLGGLTVLVFFTVVPGTAAIPEHITEEDNNDDKVTLYVGNLPYRVNEGNVQQLFSRFSRVYSVRLMRDRKTGKRKGYGFVEVDSMSAEKAIGQLNDSTFEDRTLKVRLANQKAAE